MNTAMPTSNISTQEKVDAVDISYRIRSDVWFGTQFLLVVLAVAFLLAARQPDRLLHAHFVVEDGAIFFADAYNLSTWNALTKQYAGYYHLLPRLIAEFASLFPYQYIPLVFSVAALLITTLCLCWFTLPHFRHIVAQDQLRLAIVLLLPLSPNVEAIMVIAYLQWYLLLWCILISVMQPLKGRVAQILLYLAYIISIATTPISIILLPIWMVRLWITRVPFRLMEQRRCCEFSAPHGNKSRVRSTAGNDIWQLFHCHWFILFAETGCSG